MAPRERPAGELATLPEDAKTVVSASKGLRKGLGAPDKEFEFSFGATHKARLPAVPQTKPPSPSGASVAVEEVASKGGDELPGFGASEQQAQADAAHCKKAAEAVPMVAVDAGFGQATQGPSIEEQPAAEQREPTTSFGTTQFTRHRPPAAVTPAHKAQAPMLASVSRPASAGVIGREPSNASPRSPRHPRGVGPGSLTSAIHAVMDKSPRTPRAGTPRTPPPPSGLSPFESRARTSPAPPPGTPFDRINSGTGFDRGVNSAGSLPGTPLDRVNTGPPPGTPFDRLPSNGSPGPPPGTPFDRFASNSSPGPPPGTPFDRPDSSGSKGAALGSVIGPGVSEDRTDGQMVLAPPANLNVPKNDVNPYMAQLPGWPLGCGFTAPAPGTALPVPGQARLGIPPGFFPPSASYGPLAMPPPLVLAPGGQPRVAQGAYQGPQGANALLALPTPPGPSGAPAYDGNSSPNGSAYHHTNEDNIGDWRSKEDQQWAARTSHGAKVVFLADTSGQYATNYGTRIAATAGIVLLLAGVCMLATYLAIGAGRGLL